MLVASVARAESELLVSLDYELDATHDSCPREHRFRSMVSEQLGYDPFRSAAPLTIATRASRSPGGELRGSIEWFDVSGARRGERQLSSDEGDCAALARAMSFAIAVQIQLLAQEAESAVAAPKASSGHETAQPPSAPSRPSPARQGVRDGRGPEAALGASEASRGEREPLIVLLGGGPFVALGMAPRAAPGVRAFAAARHDWFLLELGAEATAPASYSTSDTAGFDEHVALGSVAGCLVLGAWSICSVNKIGRVYVRGFGVELPREASGTMMLTGGRLTLSRELAGRWLAAPRVECLLPMGSWDVTLNRRRVWTTPGVSASLGIDLAWFF